ncbi:MAG: hypothetical protein ACR2ND_03430 [Solirubrobacteraceae bacterium]
MLRPTKPVPIVGASASISHFGGDSERAVILAVEDDGRRLVVRDSLAATHEFTLRRATAAYVLRGEQHAPRLRL